MKKILLLSNAFKESLHAIQIQSLFHEVFANHANIQCTSFPIADGGNGFAELAGKVLHGEKIPLTSLNPNQKNVEGFYVHLNKQHACIDSATFSGLHLLNQSQRNPWINTSFGTGFAIQQLIDKGYTHFTVGLGGSATMDLGMGILQALGCTFLSQEKEVIFPLPLMFDKINELIIPDNIPAVTFDFASDVQCPIIGPDGSVRMFGPQKGLASTEIEWMENKYTHLFSVLEKNKKCQTTEINHLGAAGGMAYGLLSVFEGKVFSGIEWFAQQLELEKLIAQHDLIITTEGRWDNTSEQGKGTGYIKNLSEKYQKAFYVFCGDSTTQAPWIIPINDPKLSLQQNIEKTEEHLRTKISEFKL